MALFSLIFNRPTKPGFELAVLGAPQVVEFDASLSETHERQADITDNEIEDGSNVSDHARLRPLKLTLNAIISDAPVTLLGAVTGAGLSAASQLANNAAGGGTLGNIAGTATGLGGGTLAGLLTGSPRNPADGWKLLEDVWRKRVPFTVITALQKYENMLIENLNAPRSASVGKSLEFTVVLKQVTIISSAVVKVAAFKVADDALGGQSKTELGKQAGKETTTKNQSVAFRLIGGLRGAS